jgi:hypothetical protein
MYRNLLLLLCLLLMPLSTAMARDNGSTVKGNGSAVKGNGSSAADKEPAAKELSGMSIVGNDEAPKALYIVPWKSSEIGVETGMSMMLSESDVPVDRDVFMRQLGFFEVSTKK